MPPRPADPSAPPPAPAEPRPASPAAAPLPAVRVHGVRLHAVTAGQAIDRVLDESDAGRGGVVVTPNLDHVRRVQTDPSFAALVAEADLVVADGMPVLWASRLQGTPLPERVAGSDLISTLTAAAARRGKRVFFLGGAPGTAERAVEVLRRDNPGLLVAGTYCPPLGFEEDDDQMARMTAALVEGRPDVVFVALGSPKQEFLIDRIRAVVPGAWWLGVGVSFSFLCGDVRRAPRILQKYGLEWVHRLYQEPRRLFKRYLMVGVPFGAAMLARAAGRRLSGWLPWHVESVERPSGPGLAWPVSASPRRRVMVEGESGEVADFAAYLPAPDEAATAVRNAPRLSPLSPPMPGGLQQFAAAHAGSGESASAYESNGSNGSGGAVALAEPPGEFGDSDTYGEIVPGGEADDGGHDDGRSPAGLSTAEAVGFAVGRPMPAGLRMAGFGPGSNGSNGSADGHAGVGFGANGYVASGGTPVLPAGTPGASAAASLRRLRAVVLLGGKVRPGPLELCVGRSPLDLPMDDGGRTILGQWLEHARDLADRYGLRRLPLRVTVSRHSPDPTGGDADAEAGGGVGGDFTVERDQGEYRGTGGVLRDLAQAYDDDDYILVGNASQVLLDPLLAVATALANKRAGVAMVSHRDGTPSGLMLVAVRALRQINPVGFVDFKEQALPAISREHDVRVVTARRPTGLAVRSSTDYVMALRHYHRCGGAAAVAAGRRAEVDPLAEEWRSSFSIVEAGATVAASAHVHDAVVLKGATVGDGAAVVRSVVCPGKSVKPDARIVDEFLG